MKVKSYEIQFNKKCLKMSKDKNNNNNNNNNKIKIILKSILIVSLFVIGVCFCSIAFWMKTSKDQVDKLIINKRLAQVGSK